MSPSPPHHMKSGEAFPPKTPGKLRIYSMQYCPYAQRTRLMLALKNVDHEVINIDLKDKPAWFLEKYQAGTVPVLEIDDKVIGESLITAEYIDEMYSKPGKQSLPTDPYKKAQARLLIYELGKIPSKFYGFARQAENSEAEFHSSLGYLEKLLSSEKFISSKAVSYVDYMIWPWFERIGTWCGELPKGKFPNITRWISDMKKDPVVKACSTPPEIFKKFFDGFRSNKTVYDLE
uniref:Glutathione S-transferase omega n=1 Tax=Halocynthia roretzi TaxID=7729 RepID=Q5NTL6_HALRO|nr:glutathione S-transferase omega [Halocynthia roretzi]